MKINAAKTKLMRAGPGVDPVVSLGGTQLEVVSQIKYLGSWFASDGSMDREISARISAAFGAVQRMEDTWKSRQNSVGYKITLYKTMVLTVLMYGAESWPMTKAQTKKLEVFHQRQLRIILGIRWDEFMSNEEILARVKVRSIADELRLRRLKWLGHVAQLDEGRVLRSLLFGQLDGRRAKGWRQTIQRTLAGDIAFCNGSAPTGLAWWRIIEDRVAWRNFVYARMGPVPGTGQLEVDPETAAPAPQNAALEAAEAAAQAAGQPGAAVDAAQMTAALAALSLAPHNAALAAEEAAAQVAGQSGAQLAMVADEAGPSGSQRVRHCPRLTQRMGLPVAEPLSSPLKTPSGRPRKKPAKPYGEWRKGALIVLWVFFCTVLKF
jgi:hypothetical protein